jgi:hypothetical protein
MVIGFQSIQQHYMVVYQQMYVPLLAEAGRKCEVGGVGSGGGLVTITTKRSYHTSTQVMAYWHNEINDDRLQLHCLTTVLFCMKL